MPLNLNKKELIERTFEVLDGLDIPPHPIEDNDSRIRFFNTGGYSIELRDHTVDIFEECVKTISSFLIIKIYR